MNINPKILVSKSEKCYEILYAAHQLHQTTCTEHFHMKSKLEYLHMQLTATRKKIEEKKLSNDFVRVNAEKGVMNAYR